MDEVNNAGAQATGPVMPYLPISLQYGEHRPAIVDVKDLAYQRLTICGLVRT
jgi:hypothetical protein